MSRCVRVRAVLLFCVAVAMASVAGAAGPHVGSGEFGPLVLTDLAGAKVSLADLRGKVVVLNFWATWCKPCVEEFPRLTALAEQYHDRGLVVVAASVDEGDSRTAVAPFVHRIPEGMELWLGATSDDMQRLNVGSSLPVTVLLDRSGRMARMHRGVLGDKTLDKLIEALLGSPAEPKKVPGVEQAAVPRRSPGLASARAGQSRALAACACQAAGRIL